MINDTVITGCHKQSIIEKDHQRCCTSLFKNLQNHLTAKVKSCCGEWLEFTEVKWLELITTCEVF